MPAPEVIEGVENREALDVCETPALGDVWRVIALTCDLGSIGTIVGAPGVGKTTALRAYAESTPGACYCEMSPAQSSTMVAMLTLICDALGTPAPFLCRTLYEVVCTAIEWNSVKVLLIDEAQHLNDRNLDELRCIHDQTGVPLVLAGNESLRSRFNTTRAAAFAQLTSRIGPRLDLRASTAADLGVLARHAGVHEPQAIAYLEKHIGGALVLRQAVRLLRMGRKIAGEDGIRLAHLKQAAGVLEGP